LFIKSPAKLPVVGRLSLAGEKEIFI